MRILGADFPIVLLTSLAVAFGLWAWVESARQARARRQLADWLAKNRAEAWEALPWMSRRVAPQSGIAAMKRQGVTDDPDFEVLDAEAQRRGRRTMKLILCAVASLAIAMAGMTFFGWSAG